MTIVIWPNSWIRLVQIIKGRFARVRAESLVVEVCIQLELN